MENRKTLFNNKTGEVNSESDFDENLVKKWEKIVKDWELKPFYIIKKYYKNCFYCLLMNFLNLTRIIEIFTFFSVVLLLLGNLCS